MPLRLLSILLALCVGCASSTPRPAQHVEPASSPQATDHPLAAVARAEAARASGLSALLQLLAEGTPKQRRFAARGLGRTGGAKAVAALVQALPEADDSLARAILAGLAIAGDSSAGQAVARLLRPDVEASLQRAALDTLGRIGDGGQLPPLEAALAHPDLDVRAHAAVALGLFGRRQIPLPPSIVHTLCEMQPEHSALAYGAAYALARQHEPAPVPCATTRLRSLAQHPDPEVRAVAVSGLTRGGVVDLELAERAWADPDGRVRVEAVRHMTADASGLEGARRLAQLLRNRVDQLDLETLGERPLSVELEAFAALRRHAGDETVRQLLEASVAVLEVEVVTAPESRTNLTRLRCVGMAALDAARALERCAVEESSPHHRHLQLAAAFEGAPIAVLQPFFTDADARVRGAALAAALSRDPQAKSALAHVPEALSSEHPAEAGAVAEALSAHVTPHSPWLQAVSNRVARELGASSPQLELQVSLLSILGRSGDRQFAAVCDRALASSNRTLRGAAGDCLRALDRDARPSSTPAAAPPATDLNAVLGRAISLDLLTSKGRVRITLEPHTAPWAVAAMVRAARQGAYTGAPFHRVVANFVAQGGDPTGTGWGGLPGVVLPAEPSTPAFGGGFARGAVGVADAGLDTGSGQFFIMHARAPHLEGRYTRVGRVTHGMDVVDRLVVTDTVEAVSVHISPPGDDA